MANQPMEEWKLAYDCGIPDINVQESYWHYFLIDSCFVPAYWSYADQFLAARNIFEQRHPRLFSHGDSKRIAVSKAGELSL